VALGRRELRAVAVAGVLSLVAIGVVGSQSAIGLDPSIVGLAYLGLAGAVAIRLGSVPFHLWVARSSDTAPPVALPLVLAWAPAVFVVITLGWTSGAIQPLGETFPVERALIAVIAALTVVLGAAAAAVNPDLEHVVGYSIVSDGALALLALAALDPGSWAATRSWLLAFVVAKTAFAAWVAAIHFSFGARQISELGGWARRSPLLALGLVGVFVAGLARRGWRYSRLG
jgi:NADH:ubiquinone oxidoreductase subunit 2 (subunit N)